MTSRTLLGGVVFAALVHLPVDRGVPRQDPLDEMREGTACGARRIEQSEPAPP
jgi:hypothetical protein